MTTPDVSLHRIEPGTLIVLRGVEFDDNDERDSEVYAQLVDGLKHVAGHEQFMVLRIADGEAASFTIQEVLAALGAEPNPTQEVATHGTPDHPSGSTDDVGPATQDR